MDTWYWKLKTKKTEHATRERTNFINSFEQTEIVLCTNVNHPYLKTTYCSFAKMFFSLFLFTKYIQSWFCVMFWIGLLTPRQRRRQRLPVGFFSSCTHTHAFIFVVFAVHTQANAHVKRHRQKMLHMSFVYRSALEHFMCYWTPDEGECFGRYIYRRRYHRTYVYACVCLYS